MAGLAKYLPNMLAAAIASTLGGGGGAWTPAQWFLANEQGLWFNPGDFTRYISELGPELVANGTFDTDLAGWTNTNQPAGMTWDASGCLSLNDISGADCNARTNITTVVGKTYLMEMVVKSTAGQIMWMAGDRGSGSNDYYGAATYTPSTSPTTYKVSFKASQALSSIAVSMATIGVALIERISVRELTAINTATMFQDIAGITPVTTVEQPDGLALDLRLGLVETPVTFTGFVNNTLDTLTGSGAGPWTVVEASGYGACGGNDPLTVTAGDVYKVVVDVVRNAGTISVFIGTGGGAVSQSNKPSFTTSGLKTMYLTCTSTGGSRSLSLECSGFNGSVTVVSMVKVAGNHLSQATSASRWMLSARKNLLTNTEDFADAAWQKANVVVTANADGTADKIVANAITASSPGASAFQALTSAVGMITISAKIKSAGHRYALFGFHNSGGYTANTYFDLQTGTVVANGAHPAYMDTMSATITAGADGYWDCTFTGKALETSPKAVCIVGSSVAGGLYNRDVVGDGINGVFCKEVQAEFGSTATTYQRVNTATVYDTAGFLHYVKLDGVDDGFDATFPAGTLGSNMDCFMLVRRDSGSAAILAADVGANWFAYMDAGVPGSNTATYLSGTGSSYFVDGVAVPGGSATSAAQLSAAVPVGRWAVLEVRNVDLSAWTKLRISNYGGFLLNGAIAEVILAPAQDAAARTQAREYLAAKAGITLP